MHRKGPADRTDWVKQPGRTSERVQGEEFARGPPQPSSYGGRPYLSVGKCRGDLGSPSVGLVKPKLISSGCGVGWG